MESIWYKTNIASIEQHGLQVHFNLAGNWGHRGNEILAPLDNTRLVLQVSNPPKDSTRVLFNGDEENAIIRFLRAYGIEACRWKLHRIAGHSREYTLSAFQVKAAGEHYARLWFRLDKNPQRQITPHKGGRSDQINARLTPQEKLRLQAVLKGKAIADWIMEQVERIERKPAE